MMEDASIGLTTAARRVGAPAAEATVERDYDNSPWSSIELSGGEDTNTVVGGVPHAPPRERYVEESSHGIIQTPHANDILLGRGGQINQHPGNEVFRAWISERKQDYILAKAKKDKTRISEEIYNSVKSTIPPGRFLTKMMAPGRKTNNHIVEEGGWWIEVDYNRAHSKISQCLREGAPALKSQRKARITPRSRTTRRSGRSPGKKMSTLLSTLKSPKPVASQNTLKPSYTNRGMGSAFGKRGVRVRDVFSEHGTPPLSLPPHIPLVHMEEFTQPISAVASAIPTPQTPRKPTPSELEGNSMFAFTNIQSITQASFVSPLSTPPAIGVANPTTPKLNLEKQTSSDPFFTRNHSLSDHPFIMESADEPFVNPFTSDLPGDNIVGGELDSGSSGVSESLKQWAKTIGGKSSGSSSSNHSNNIGTTRKRRSIE